MKTRQAKNKMAGCIERINWDFLPLHQLHEAAMNRSEWRLLVQKIARSRQQLDAT